jgi:hypothetical protein
VIAARGGLLVLLPLVLPVLSVFFIILLFYYFLFVFCVRPTDVGAPCVAGIVCFFIF